MKYLFYIDESGDWGFSKRSSDHTVLALIDPEDRKAIKNSLKTAKKRVLGRKGRKMPELKFNELQPSQRVRILKKISKKNFRVLAIVLRKDTVTSKYLLRPHIISQYLIDKLTGRGIYLTSKASPDKKALRKVHSIGLNVDLVVDKWLSRKYRKDFDEYVKARSKRRFTRKVNIKIQHITSESELCLQLADLCAGSIFSKYELGNEEYYNLIKDKILDLAEYFNESK